jgi:tetrapyrrole methylase family protein/MazG family protein
LDRQTDLDHLTSLFVPPLDEPGSVVALQEVVAHLRSPEGCPWDREQTHRSLRPEMIEETYEAVQAIDEEDWDKLSEELGDLLLEVTLQMQIGADEGEFRSTEVVAGIVNKMVRRHPHVFGDVVAGDSRTVVRNWEESKRLERGDRGYADMLEGLPASLPALAQCQSFQKRVARVGPAVPAVEEAQEMLRQAGQGGAPEDPAARESLVAEALFAVVACCYQWNLDAESVLREANGIFARAFSKAAHEVEEGRLDWEAVSWDELALGRFRS